MAGSPMRRLAEISQFALAFTGQGGFLSCCWTAAGETLRKAQGACDAHAVRATGPLAVLRTCMFLSTSLVVTVCVPTFIGAVCQMVLAKPAGYWRGVGQVDRGFRIPTLPQVVP